MLSFYACFSRTAFFEWFVTIVVGLMLRSDCLGLTSIIRDLALMPSLYPSLEHFFRASSWEWDSIFYTWAKTVAAKAPLRRIAGRTVLIGNGTKRAADGKYMPCIKKMVQESESASKPEFIYGHFFGAVGVLIGNTMKLFCLPLSIQIHDGGNTGCRASMVNGKGLKLINKYYNKQVSHYGEIAKRMNHLDFTNRMARITSKRNRKMDDYMHKASRRIVDFCHRDRINTIVIGCNKDWKWNSNLCRKVQIKICQQDNIVINHEPEYLIVMYLNKSGNVYEVYNGPGKEPWNNAGKRDNHNNRHIMVNKLMELDKNVSGEMRIKPVYYDRKKRREYKNRRGDRK